MKTAMLALVISLVISCSIATNGGTATAISLELEQLFDSRGLLLSHPGILAMGYPDGIAFLNDGVTWGATPKAFRDEGDSLLYELATYQLGGVPYFGGVDVNFFEFPHPDIELESAMVDVLGSPIPWEVKREWETSNTYQHNFLHPLMEELTKERIRVLIDAGVDGIHFDDFEVMDLVEFGGSFDPWTERQFADYLASEYSPEELQARFGILPNEDFTLGGWIRKRNLSQTWNSPPYEPLVLQYMLFLEHMHTEVFQRIVSYARDYARTEYGQQIAIGINCHVLDAARLASLCDFFVSETLPPSYAIAAPRSEIYRSIDATKPRTFLVETNNAEGELDTSPESITDIVRWQTGTIHACGSSPVLPDPMLVWQGDRYGPQATYSTSTVSEMAAFLASNRHLYELERQACDIAVLFDEASARNLSMQAQGWEWAFERMLALLLEAGLEFDVVHSPDPRFSDSELTASMLAGYAVLLVPDAISPPVHEQEAILNYIREGGTAIITGDTAKFDLALAPASSELADALAIGTVDNANGELIYIGSTLFDPVGLTERVLEIIPERLPPQTVVEGQQVFHWTYSEDQCTAIHIANQDYSVGGGQMVPAEAVKLRHPLSKLPAEVEACFLSPDTLDAKSLSVRTSSGYAEVELPAFRSEAIVIFRPACEANCTGGASSSNVDASSGRVELEVAVTDTELSVVTWYIDGSPILTQSTRSVPAAHRLFFSRSEAVSVRCVDVFSDVTLGEWQLESPDELPRETLNMLWETSALSDSEINEALSAARERLHAGALRVYTDWLQALANGDDFPVPRGWSQTSWNGGDTVPLYVDSDAGTPSLVITKERGTPTGTFDLSGRDCSSYRYIRLVLSASPGMTVSIELGCHDARYPDGLMVTSPGRLVQVNESWTEIIIPFDEFRVPSDERIAADPDGALDLTQMAFFMLYPSSRSPSGILRVASAEFY